MKKKRWEAPKLVVLYRGKAEESVLGFCKTVEQGGGPGVNAHACVSQDLPCGTTCDAWVTT